MTDLDRIIEKDDLSSDTDLLCLERADDPDAKCDVGYSILKSCDTGTNSTCALSENILPIINVRMNYKTFIITT